MQNNLNTDDLNLLNKLFDISKKIFKIYNHEVFFKDNLNLKYLDICFEIENELYKEIKDNKLYDYIKYLDQNNSFKTFTDYDLLLDNFTDLFIFKRVYNHLNNISTNKIIKTYQEANIKKNDYPSFDVSMFITNQVHDDIERLLSYFLYKSSKNIKNIKFKDELLKLSYLIYYLNPRIENEFKNSNNFQKVILLSNSTSELFNIDSDTYNRILTKYFLRYIKVHVNGLINIHDADYKDDYFKLREIIYEGIIKSYLKLKSHDYNKFLEDFHDIINKNKNNKTSALVLKKLLEDKKIDSNIIQLHTKALVLKEIKK